MTEATENSESIAAPAARSRTAERIGAAALVAALAAILLYAPRLWLGGHGFVNYDDPYLTSADNPAIGKGLLGGLPDLLTFWKSPQFMNAWLPLYYWSLGLDHALFGDAPLGWHLHSVLLHAGGAAMVAVLARRLGLGAAGAAVAGVAFAVHPALTENVAWIASRKDVLSFLWMTFAAWAYLEAIRRGRPALHLLGAICLAVSLLAKGTTLVLPLLLAVHALFLRDERTSRRDRILPVIPYAAVAALLTGVHLWIAGREGTAGGAPGAGIGAVLVADLDAAGRYVLLLLAPFRPLFRQSVEHGVDAHAADAARVVVGAALVVLWAGATWWTWRRRPRVAALLLAVPIALAPFNNVLPRTSVLFAERYAHVAVLPVALAVGALASGVGNGPIWAAVLTTAFAAFTWFRLPVWENAVTLWQDAAETAPRSAFVRMQLADAYGTRARTEPAAADDWNARAEAAWRDAASKATDELSRMRAETGLGTHLLTTAPGGTNTEERVRESLALLESSERRLEGIEAPGARGTLLSTIRANRAAAREALGDAEGALLDWRGAVLADERNAAALIGLARVYFATGRGPEAVEILAKAAALAPDDTVAARERAKLRLSAGDAAGAKSELEQALARRPQDFDLLLAAARLDASLQRPIDAEKRFRKALEVRPGDEDARQGIAAALLEQAQAQCARDDLDAARKAGESAAEMAPKSSAPEQILGIVARRGGDLEEATRRFRRARDLFPEGVRIREALASVLLERAMAAYDAGSDEAGNLLAEEAVAADAPSSATRFFRLEQGVGGWPPPVRDADERTTVTRRAALRGLTLLACGRAEEAMSELVVAERGSAGSDAALRRCILVLLVRARFLSGRPDEALAAAEELPSLVTPERPWQGWSDLAAAHVERGLARRAAGDAAHAREDFDRARTNLDAAAAHGMPRARLYLRRGEIRFAEEEFVDATKEFDEATRLDPADPEPYLDRAAVFRTHFLLEEQKSYLNGAEKELRRALLVAPSDPRSAAALGEVLILSSRPGEAYPWLQRALLADPSQQTTRRLLAELAVRAGRSHLEKKELKEAYDTAVRAAALAAPAPDATIFLGDVLRAQGDWARALAQYEEAAAKWPDSPEPKAALAKHHLDLGHAWLLKSRRREAIQAFRTALAVPQEKVDVSAAEERLHGIAVSAFEDGMRLVAEKKFAEAAESFATSILAEPTRETRFNLGLVLTQAGDLEGAERAYAEALAATPEDVSARANRAAILLRLGRWSEAIDEYRWIVGHRPEDDPDRKAAERAIREIEAEEKALEESRPK